MMNGFIIKDDGINTKKGFTLVEMIAVIAILAILILIAVPTYNVVSERIKQSSYETKIQNIISHAETFAENTNNFVFDVGTLIEQGLLEADNESGEYLDPRNGRDMRCDIINVVFENNQYVASITESETCYTDEELQNLFGMFEIKIYRPDGTEVEPIEGTEWIREQDVVLKYELKENYQGKGYEDNITQVIWSGEGEKTCTSDFSNCNYDIHTDLIKNVTANLQINLNINGSTIISRTNKRVLVDLENPSVDNIVTGTDLNEQERNRTEFDLSDGNGSGVKYYAILPSGSSCSGASYESARKNINSNHIVEYLDGGDYTICVEDNVGNTGEGSVSLRTINFNANGGSVEIDKKVIGTNTSYGVLPTPTRAYYHFLGWYTAPTGGVEVTPETILTEDITVYAHWQIYSYTVTYNPTGGSVSPTSVTRDHGSALGTLPTPTRTNYKFLGWFTAESGGTQVSSSTTVTSTTTLYAHWELIAYTVRYNATENGGTTSVQSKLVTIGSQVDLSPSASKSGYDFIGWNINPNATSGLSSLTMGTSDVTLYAIYRKTIVVTLYDYSGTSRATPRTLTGYAYNKNTSASIKLLAPRTWTTYRCGNGTTLGWSTSSAASASVTHSSTGTYSFSSSTTLYARYSQTTTLTLDATHDGVVTIQIISPVGTRHLSGFGNFLATVETENGTRNDRLAIWYSGKFSYEHSKGVNGRWIYYADSGDNCPWTHNGDRFRGWGCLGASFPAVDSCPKPNLDDIYNSNTYWNDWNIYYYCNKLYACVYSS